MRLLSSAGSTYNRDYQAEGETGQQNSTMNVFTKRDGKIRHFYATEKGNLLDLTPKAAAGPGDPTGRRGASHPTPVPGVASGT